MNTSFCSLVTGFVCGLTWALPPAAAAVETAPRIEHSRIQIDATASGIHAEGLQGGTSSRKSVFGKKKTTSTPDLPGQVDVGVVDLRGGAVLKDSDVRIHAAVGGISARGATVRVGSLVVGP